MTPLDLQFAPFRLDRANECLWRGTEQIELSPKAFAVLAYLAERAGRLVTKQELLDAVWPDIHVTEGVLKRAVLEIRKALGNAVEEPRFIQTLHRRGYRFLRGQAERLEAAAGSQADGALVGRERELNRLDSWLAEAVKGARQIVFVTGEAGLGKTTLVDHWMQCFQRRGSAAAAARGRCIQQFGSGEPYLPVFEALDQLSHRVGRRLVEVLRSRAPTWLMHMPSLLSLEERVKLRDEVFGSTRERMLREITDALEALSAEMPLVLVLEDLHWSDPSTIDLLTSLGRRTNPARILMVATYRPADAGRSAAALLAARHEMELHRQCRVLALSYLSAEDTAEYLAARFPNMDSPAELAAALHQRSSGTPLYLVCLADELERLGRLDADAAAIREIVPDTLQQMFERQASDLSEAEQRTVAAAAAAGETFAVAAIAGALGEDVAHSESVCEGLLRRQVILRSAATVRYPDGTESPGYAFLHELCRDALYRRIPPGRRARLHGSLGRAAEELYAADPARSAAELARHFELAGEARKAIQYLRMAAEGAAGRHSSQAAAEYLERALTLTARLREGDQETTQMDLLEQRALIRLGASDMPGAAGDFESLAEQARRTGDSGREIKALLEGVPALLFVDYRRSMAALEAARTPRSAAVNPVLGALGDVYYAFFRMYLGGWTREMQDLMDAALPLVREMPDIRSKARAAWMTAGAHVFSSNYPAAIERAREAQGLSRKAGVYFDYFVASLYLNWAVLLRGDLGGSLQICRDGIELATRNGSSFPLLWFNVRTAWARMEAFDFAGPLEICERYAAHPVLAANRSTFVPLYLWLGLARMGSGDLDGAWAAFETLREAVEGGGIPFQCVCPLLRAQCECALARGDRMLAKSLAERLRKTAEEHGERVFLAEAHRLLAQVQETGGDFRGAEDHVARAMAAIERSEAWTAERRICAAAARIFGEMGRREESTAFRERARRAARQTAETLAGEPGLRERFERGASAELEPPAAPASGRL